MGVITHPTSIYRPVEIRIITICNAMVQSGDKRLQPSVCFFNYGELMRDSAALLPYNPSRPHLNRQTRNIIHWLSIHYRIMAQFENGAPIINATHKMQTRWYKTQKKPCNWGTPNLPFRRLFNARWTEPAAGEGLRPGCLHGA